MNTRIWLIPATFLILAGGVFVWYRYYRARPDIGNQGENINLITLEGVAFKVETASTARERAAGLSNRSQLCEQCGMIFIFPQNGYHAFWMKDTLIPLDIIWFNEHWQVVDYTAWAQPQGNREIGDLPSYKPKEPARFVLEIPGGTIKRITNFKVGSQAEIN